MSMNKKGDFTGILYLVASIGAFAIFLLIVAYIVPQITGPLAEQIGTTAEVNRSLGVSESIAEHTFPTLWFILFIGLMLGLMATAWFVPSHPIFVPIFAILLVVAVLVGMAVSNAYEELSNVDTLSGVAEDQGAISFFMLNLPYVAFIVGILVLIVSFAKPGGSESASLG